MPFGYIRVERVKELIQQVLSNRSIHIPLHAKRKEENFNEPFYSFVCPLCKNILYPTMFTSLIRDEFKLAPFEIKSWPYLVGRPVDEAVREIEQKHPGKTVSPYGRTLCFFSSKKRKEEEHTRFASTNHLLRLSWCFCFRVQGGEIGASLADEIGLEACPCPCFLRRR